MGVSRLLLVLEPRGFPVFVQNPLSSRLLLAHGCHHPSWAHHLPKPSLRHSSRRECVECNSDALRRPRRDGRAKPFRNPPLCRALCLSTLVKRTCTCIAICQGLFSKDAWERDDMGQRKPFPYETGWLGEPLLRFMASDEARASQHYTASMFMHRHPLGSGLLCLRRHSTRPPSPSPSPPPSPSPLALALAPALAHALALPPHPRPLPLRAIRPLPFLSPFVLSLALALQKESHREPYRVPALCMVGRWRAPARGEELHLLGWQRRRRAQQRRCAREAARRQAQRAAGCASGHLRCAAFGGRRCRWLRLPHRSW